MRTLIIGASGKIGKYFLQKRNKNVLFTYFNNKIRSGIKFDILNDDINKVIKNFKINNVVLLSAYSDPDFCKKFKTISYDLNVKKTKKILKNLINKNIYFIFFSTEFIYKGDKGSYTEKSKANPINLYGKQKLEIEKFLKKKGKNFAIFRIAKTFGDDINDNTLVTNFIKLAKKKNQKLNAATDQKFSPLFVKDLIRITNYFIKNTIIGTYNIGGSKSYSRYELYKKFNILIDKSKKNLNKIELSKKNLCDFNFFEKRPKDVSFNINLLKNTINFNLTSIEDVFKRKL